MSESYATEQDPPAEEPAEEQTEQPGRKLLDWIDKPNIADDLDDEQLSKIGMQVMQEFEIDDRSRNDWIKENEKAIELAMQVSKAKTYPWPNASNLIYPLITTAAVQFHARAYPEIIKDKAVVKGQVIGRDEGEPQLSPKDGTPLMQEQADGSMTPLWAVPPSARKERADRIGGHMSYQLLEEQTEWEEDTDKLLIILPIVGCIFRKSYFNKSRGCNSSDLVHAQNLVINYKAKSMERAPRISEILEYYPLEIEENVRAGLFLDHEYGIATESDGDDDAPHQFIEQHRFLDLDEDGYAEPYVVTVHKDTRKVARIVVRYDHDGVKVMNDKVIRIEPVHYYTKYDFLPNPDGGIYGIGYGKLLGPINAAVNTTLNLLMDAGHLQNNGGGFIGKGLSMHTGSVKFKANEWKILNTPGNKIREAIVPMEHNGPSAQLVQLLTFLIETGREVASVKDVLTGDIATNMQPTTLLALIEQGLKVFTGIYKRIHRAAKKEYQKLYRLNRIYLNEQDEYKVGDEWHQITREDYELGSGVVPISDPTMVSDMQKLARAEFLSGFKDDPTMDGAEIRKRMLDAANIADPENLFAKEQPPNPAVLFQAEKLELERIATKAKAVSDMAGAIEKLAKADKAAGESLAAWTTAQFEALKSDIEGLGNGQGNPADQGGGLPAVAPPPGEQDLPAIPAGLQ